MNTMTMDIWMRARSAATHAVFLPLDAWSNRRTFGITLGVAALVFALGLQAWRACGLINLDAARSRPRGLNRMKRADSSPICRRCGRVWRGTVQRQKRGRAQTC
ncbi:hypothetical protein BRCH_02348c [Candidatus Burkholderia brachyanthoides]|nr:hypothetical protein BRCH_02348c [Candidatus Burkholderia brachyanthoides]